MILDLLVLSSFVVCIWFRDSYDCAFHSACYVTKINSVRNFTLSEA